MTSSNSLPTRFRFFLSRAISRIKGAPYLVDEAVPIGTLFLLTARRLMWLSRGVSKTLLFQRKPSAIFLGPRVTLLNVSRIRFGKYVTLWPGVFIDGLSRKGIEICDNVTIGDFSIIRATGVLLDIGVGFRIGKNSALGAFSFVGAGGGVSIGDNVIMGQYVSFHAENHNYESFDRPIRVQGTNRRGIVIEDDCWIGSKVTFLDGTHVGKGCVIGAGSVVTGNIPDYSIAVGVPARVIKNRRDASVQRPE